MSDLNSIFQNVADDLQAIKDKMQSLHSTTSLDPRQVISFVEIAMAQLQSFAAELNSNSSTTAEDEDSRDDESIDSSESEKPYLIAELEGENEQLQEQIDSLKQEIHSYTKAIKELHQTFENMQATLERSRVEQQRSGRSETELRVEVRQLRDAIGDIWDDRIRAESERDEMKVKWRAMTGKDFKFGRRGS